MKLGQLSKEQLVGLSAEQITKIVYGDWKDNNSSAQVALLLGGITDVCRERAEAAAALWHAGRVPFIIPTGGVKRETPFGEITEAELLRRHLLELGVPEDRILMEEQATTTIENMIYGALVIEKNFRFYNIHSVMIVTSAMHLNRAVRLGRNYLPSSVTVSGYCIAQRETDAQHWHQSAQQRERAEKEVGILWRLIKTGQTPDIEF